MKPRMNVIAASLVLAALTLVGAGCNTAGADSESAADGSPAVSMSSISAERVEVVHFHGTSQCYSCKKVGELAFRTVKERFPEEWESGRLVFMSVNGELPENRNTVVKFQATGSSLFLNAVSGGKEYIAEDVTVWRLYGNEQKFIDYLEGQIRTLLAS